MSVSKQSLLPKEMPRKLYTHGPVQSSKYVLAQTDATGLRQFRARNGKLGLLQDAEVYSGAHGRRMNIAGDIFDIVDVKTIIVLVEDATPVTPSPAAVVEGPVIV